MNSSTRPGRPIRRLIKALLCAAMLHYWSFDDYADDGDGYFQLCNWCDAKRWREGAPRWVR